MKKIILMLILLLLSMLLLSSCGCQTVPAGYVGVKVYLLGNNKGIDNEVVKMGRYWLGINEQMYLYPVFMKQYSFTQEANEDSPKDEAFYFQNKDGVKCNFDIAIQAQANPEKVSILFQKYRDDFKDILHTFVGNKIKDKIQKYYSALSIEELYSSKKVEVIRLIEIELKEELAVDGIDVKGIVLLSDIRFPKEVEDAIVSKIKATQEALQRENEVQKAKAEAEIKITQAKAEAESIRLKQMNMTKNLIEYEAVQKWDGKLPQYMLNNAVPFINIQK